MRLAPLGSFLLQHLPGCERHLGGPSGGDTLCCHLIVLTTPWRLVLGGHSSVQGKQAGTGERGSARGWG